MAQLPPDGEWLVQSSGNIVTISNRYTEEEIVSFDGSDSNAAALAQKTIHDSNLSAEQKSYAHFWCGYFYGQINSNKVTSYGDSVDSTSTNAENW